jgi:hypothetical protein
MRNVFIFILIPILFLSASDKINFEESENYISVRWETPDFEPATTDEGYLIFDIHGAIIEGEPGEPGIPRVDLTVILPSEGDYDFKIIAIEWKPFESGILAPVNHWEGWPEGPFTPSYRPSAEFYSQNRWFPDDPVYLFDAGFARNIRLGSVRIHPIRFNPVTGQIEKISQLECRVDYKNPGRKSAFSPDPLEKAVISSSINPSFGADFLRQRARRRVSEDIFGHADQWFTFGISNSGLYVIDREFLTSLGYNPSLVLPNDVRIFDEGWRELPVMVETEMPELKEIPLFAVGLEDGRFDAGDGLYFYARGQHGWFVQDGEPTHHYHRFATENRYWISIGGSFPNPARRLIAEDFVVSGEPAVRGKFMHHVENDAVFAKTSNDIQWGQERTSSKNITYIDSRLDTTQAVVFSYRNVPVEGESVPLGTPNVNSRTPISQSTRYYTYTGNYESAFTKGTNTIEINFSGVSVLFDYYEFTYYIDLEPKSGLLTFAGKDTASKYALSGFGTSPVVFDITNQTDLRLLNVTEISGKQVFSDTFSNRQYFACEMSLAQRPTSPQLTPVANLRNNLFDCDMVMLVPKGLETDTAGSLQKFIAYKQDLGIDIEWVFVEDVLNEFGFGVNDPTAIRDFLRYIWLNSPAPPVYVLLVGDATWDPRGITGPAATFCPAALCVANAPDDYFYSVTEIDYTPDFAGGRVPINTINDWRHFVAKLMAAESEPEYGPWRIRYVWCADDDRKTGNIGDISDHTTQTANNIVSLPAWTDSRAVYMIDYPLTSTGLKPSAQKDLIDYWNDGSVLVNYIGHGNYRLWSHEQVFEGTSSIPKLTNEGKLPLMVSASCEVGLFYRTSGQCIAEQLVLRPGSGTHSSIAATRMTMAPSNGALNYDLVQNIWGRDRGTTLGLALLTAKGTAGYGSTKGQYVLFGDPTMLIGPPELKVQLEAEPDSLIAGRLIQVSGEVHQDSTLRDDFNGTAYVLVHDSGYWATYYSPYLNRNINYFTPGKRLFAGPVDVIGGRFTAEFVMPIDISFGTSNAKITGYIYSSNEEGVGVLSPLTLYGDTNLVITDSIPPLIDISLEGPGFCDMGVLCGDGILFCSFFDSSGINTSGATGHGIIMTIDGQEASAVDLSSYFSYDRNSHISGTVTYPVSGLEPGIHTIRIRAWDNMGNSAVEEFIFEADDCILAISNPLAYPNPFKNETEITFNIDEPASIEIDIYTLSGRFVRKLESAVEPAFGIVHWDGNDSHGTPVANGVYIAKIKATSEDGERVQDILKIAKAR